jgi:hypothetical protein
MTQLAEKKRVSEKVKIDKEFRRIIERNLRRDRELLERLAKI